MNVDCADLIKYVAPAQKGITTMIKDLIIYIKWRWECWKQRKTLKIVRQQQGMLLKARKGNSHGRQGSKRKP